MSFSFISSFIFSFSILITCQSNSSVSGTLNVRHGGGGGGSRQENNRDEGGMVEILTLVEGGLEAMVETPWEIILRGIMNGRQIVRGG